MHVDTSIKELERLLSFLQKFRETGFEESLIEAKEIASEMGIEPVFMEKRTIHKKRQFGESSSEAVTQSAAESFKVNYFLYIVDQAISSFKTRAGPAADPSRNLWFRLYTPTAATTKLPIIIFFHGGGFAFMSAASKPYDDFCQRLAREIPAVVVSVNYDDGFDVLKAACSRARISGSVFWPGTAPAGT
ncbi:putative carboxylesterase [Rosa chinensis]|uniref:Putative carboxylesterase n=1 Tax=Rosa chinensis TaxID=74649 RepID=A0A2P6PKG9_ROSCH|nr:putative carboxylesterase [Rosa chinensis]